MENDNTSFTNEYRDIMEFILQMQESARIQSDAILSEKKELEYKKRQQQYLIQEQEKKNIPNMSMFSPLSSDDSSEEVSYKDDLEKIVSELTTTEERWKKHNEICGSFERLKKLLSDMDLKLRQPVAEINLSKEKVAVPPVEETLPLVPSREMEPDVLHTSNASKDNFTNYSIKLLKTQEMDRNRISRDLHDSTVQSLTGFGHKLEYCSRMVDKDPTKVKLELQSMIDVNKEIIHDMRKIIYDLRPMSLNNLGFVSSVEAYCQHLRRNDNFDVVLKINGKEKELNSITSVTLFRILQEACTNALKHAKAKKVYIRISFTNENIELDVDDDGVGFNLEAAEEKAQEDILHGFGLSTMRERAKLLYGTFSINTRPGFGTKIHVSVPLNAEAGEEYYE